MSNSADAEIEHSRHKLLQAMVDSTCDFAMFTLDEERLVTTWNCGAARIFGYTGEEIIGGSGDILFTPEDRAQGAPEHEAATAKQTGRAEDERWHLRKDGSRFYASGVMVSLAAQGVRGLAKVARDLTDRKEMEDALRAAHTLLEDRIAERTQELAAANASLAEQNRATADSSRALSKAQETERLRISRELHDGVGQLLTGLSLQLTAVQRRAPAELAEDLKATRQLVDEISKEVHEVALELRPTSLDDIGLVEALQAYAEKWTSRTRIALDFHTNLADRLSADVELALYRVTQEALNNIARHSGAKQVSIMLELRDADVALLIEDDGAGFDVEQAKVAAQAAGRLGMLGMRERMAAVGGNLEIESSSESGTSLFATAARRIS